MYTIRNLILKEHWYLNEETYDSKNNICVLSHTLKTFPFDII